VRVVSLHRDVLVVTSQILQVNCTIVRGPVVSMSARRTEAGSEPLAGEETKSDGETSRETVGEDETGITDAFVIDSPVLPQELELLPSLVEQAGFPPPRGLLVTHADWDHMLAPLAFPEARLGCAESTAARLHADPGAVHRALRDFDEHLYVTRHRPLTLGSIQPLAIPGQCGIGGTQLELYPTEGHTADGMAVWIPWARVLVVGDYVSALKLPTLNAGDRIDAYLATLDNLRALIASAEHVVTGHGPVLDGAQASAILEEDVAYLRALAERGTAAELPAGRRTKAQRRLHGENVAERHADWSPDRAL
jgi:glyoxylase-like metal-dependent hydrolase (beta-lactamase superfamily II)